MSESDDLHIDTEANYFAMCLLMPDFMVREEVARLEPMPIDRAVKALAMKFKVEETIMAIRLGQLGYYKTFGGK